MNISAVSCTATMPDVSQEISQLRSQINQLHQEAGTTPPDTTSFRQDVHQLRTEVGSLNQALGALKGGATGEEPVTPGALQAVQQDIQSAETGVKNLGADLSGVGTSPPQSGSGVPAQTSIDVFA